MQALRLPYPGPAWAADPAGEAAVRVPREPKGIPRGSAETVPGNSPREQVGEGASWADLGILPVVVLRKGTPTHLDQDSGGRGEG